MPLAAKAPGGQAGCWPRWAHGAEKGVGLQEEAPGPPEQSRVAVRAGTGDPSAPGQYKRLGPSPRTCPSQNGGRERAEVTLKRLLYTGDITKKGLR
nr:uncharacterized protein LOC104003620 isoform X2 [Pan troglodytes]